jgi:hypothetical protein
MPIQDHVAGKAFAGFYSERPSGTQTAGDGITGAEAPAYSLSAPPERSAHTWSEKWPNSRARHRWQALRGFVSDTG